jgi:TM2 domain-containing membrane protein YozV
MNCANHPDVAVAAYCQQCGKPLCSQCVRSVSGLVYCETCLAARLGMPPAGVPGAPFPPSGAYGVPPVGAPNPGLAAFLGFIPGVGAMYNGQFVKALVHVLVFAVLVSISDQHGIFGLFIAAWVFYQVFDAYQTAKARRDGMPLPDPFGLNELGQKIGIHPNTMPHSSHVSSGAVPPAGGVSPTTSYGPVPPPPSQQSYTTVPVPPEPFLTPMEPLPPMETRRQVPVGAIILIAVGLLFLLQSLGVLGHWWIGHSWPWIVIALGAWLLFRRMSEHSGGEQ